MRYNIKCKVLTQSGIEEINGSRLIIPEYPENPIICERVIGRGGVYYKFYDEKSGVNLGNNAMSFRYIPACLRQIKHCFDFLINDKKITIDQACEKFTTEWNNTHINCGYYVPAAANNQGDQTNAN